ncbi:DNA polymerase Y family protein [Caenimonas sedimenti]|uniref:DNA polymerase Y family protein n=1 Tax=Caenimonas sedimenti TaxID=2596921 RepID=A0A562ZKB6_9BURK|nr:DNA polymerase Y family protein [Caenimonas sedimenti]TWO69032.1 DNA polymerase Y family protein [Caenimonas sedimenti]
MDWIALSPSLADERQAWGWRALQVTPRVAWVDEALLLEVSASERLFGGRQALLRFLVEETPLSKVSWARGRTALVALASLRLQARGIERPKNVDGLPLDVLTAATEHLPTLERIGCRTWGDLRSLPRGGLARRFGSALLDALDAGYAERPERYAWITLPESFDMNLELVSLATTAPELMWSAQRLLTQLQVWLQARHRGVLALELEWTLDLRRLNGKRLPSHERLPVRTAEPTQDITHLRRLVNEHLGRAQLAAPANHLRLRSLETQPWHGDSRGFLPEDNRQGEKLHQFIERLSARLGPQNVVVPMAHADWRPERMQQWAPARDSEAQTATQADALYPPWLLPQPLALEVRNDKPHFGGPLERLTRLYRVETGWWENGEPALRDYFVARSQEAGLLWIYRERPVSLAADLEHTQKFRWFLQGLYA